MSSDLISTSTCPACGHQVAVSFFDGGHQPLCTIAWPQTLEAARAMAQLPLSFVRCVDCGHVYNRDFDYADVPYSDKPNLMYNKAPIWGGHLRAVRDLILDRLPDDAVVVEIGCGEGHLLRALADAKPSGRYIGFDPNGSVNTEDGKVEARKELFEPSVHLAECKPDFLIGRHLLEHLINPQGFLQHLAFAAEWNEMQTRLFLEVPCIDRVFETGRIADFYYEHNSHFTTRSFTRMVQTSVSEVELIDHGYNGEVIFGLARLGGGKERAATADAAVEFRDQAKRAKAVIGAQLAELQATGNVVAVWGGTGKGAAFMNYFDVDAERFPLVVDSDPEKVGTFVPGKGQQIKYRDSLLEARADVIIIPTQWRAKDIVVEMQGCGIQADRVLIEHQGRLVDYHNDEHPYT